uniref:Uncharacterized protein n=1 Tax=Arundo donax TaxID=35708 RepID=A0A0A9BQ95_ARUDO
MALGTQLAPSYNLFPENMLSLIVAQVDWFNDAAHKHEH